MNANKFLETLRDLLQSYKPPSRSSWRYQEDIDFLVLYWEFLTKGLHLGLEEIMLQYIGDHLGLRASEMKAAFKRVEENLIEFEFDVSAEPTFQDAYRGLYPDLDKWDDHAKGMGDTQWHALEDALDFISQGNIDLSNKDNVLLDKEVNKYNKTYSAYEEYELYIRNEYFGGVDEDDLTEDEHEIYTEYLEDGDSPLFLASVLVRKPRI